MLQTLHALEDDPQLHNGARDGEHPVDNAPAFLQLQDKYKQELVKDTRLTKAADVAAKQHVILASDVPDAWKKRQLKAVGRKLRHWTKKVGQPFGAPVSGVRATGAPATSPSEDDFDAGPVQAWLTQLVKTAQGIKRSASPGGPSRPGRKPPVPPKPSFTPSAKKKLRFTSEVSTEKLAKELPFSEEPGAEPWDTPSDRVASIKISIKRNIQKREAAVAKQKGRSLAKKALE